jgi:hypothetical protein
MNSFGDAHLIQNANHVFHRWTVIRTAFDEQHLEFHSERFRFPIVSNTGHRCSLRRVLR